MSRHTAPEELLLEYAAGILPEGLALVVALHAALQAVDVCIDQHHRKSHVGKRHGNSTAHRACSNDCHLMNGA